MAFKSFFSTAAAHLAVQKGDKTVDPRYTEAKALYRSLSADNEKVVGSLLAMQSQIKQLADEMQKMGVDCKQWFSDAPQDMKDRANTIAGVSGQFHNITTSFFSPTIDPHVITPLTEFQKDISRIQAMKERHRELCRDYDIKRITLKKARSTEKDPHVLANHEKETENAKTAYEQCNEEFITTVQSLSDKRSKSLHEPATKLVAILSQYLMQVFKDMQVYRTVIPQEVLEKKYDEPKETVYPEVEAEDPYEALLKF